MRSVKHKVYSVAHLMRLYSSEFLLATVPIQQIVVLPFFLQHRREFVTEKLPCNWQRIFGCVCVCVCVCVAWCLANEVKMAKQWRMRFTIAYKRATHRIELFEWLKTVQPKEMSVSTWISFDKNYKFRAFVYQESKLYFAVELFQFRDVAQLGWKWTVLVYGKTQSGLYAEKDWHWVWIDTKNTFVTHTKILFELSSHHLSKMKNLTLDSNQEKKNQVFSTKTERSIFTWISNFPVLSSCKNNSSSKNDVQIFTPIFTSKIPHEWFWLCRFVINDKVHFVCMLVK